jgi:anti-anti-sigma factor
VPPLTVAVVPGPCPDQVVVRLTGEGDLSTLPVLSEALVHAANLGTAEVVVDVAAVRFWDSSSLRALAAVTAELAASDRCCRLVGATAGMRRLITAAAFSDALEVDGPPGAAHGTGAPVAAGDVRNVA